MHQRDDHRRGNAELRRSARSRQTPAERDARRQEDTEIRREGGLLGEQDRLPRAQTGLTYECMRAPAPAPFALELPISAPTAEPGCCVGRRSPCAVVMEGSRPLLSLPCLKAGKRCLGRLPSGHSAGSTTTSALTAMGVSGDEGFVRQPVPSCVKIHGRTYHRVLPAEMRGPVQWYVHDPDQRRVEANALSLDQQLVDAIQRTLININPYDVS